MSDDQQTPSTRRDTVHPWSWPQFAMAVGPLPLSLIMWAFGLDAVFAPHPNRAVGLVFVLSPVVALAGIVWIVVLVVRKVRSK
jgi:hypothetical protein